MPKSKNIKTAQWTQAARLEKMTGQIIRGASVHTADQPDGTTETQPDVMPAERVTVSTAGQPDGRTSRRRDKAGKRAQGYIQIAGLIPPATRDALTVALAFEDRDLSELLTDLLNDWLANQPPHVRAAIEARQAKQ